MQHFKAKIFKPVLAFYIHFYLNKKIVWVVVEALSRKPEMV
ncbi:hypothetical protein AS4_33100 [Acinetobacter guillouiae]|nr:hypothetical protein AS4_33100 [Acinetobacter guillouiae]